MNLLQDLLEIFRWRSIWRDLSVITSDSEVIQFKNLNFYLMRNLGLHKPQYKITNIDRFYVIQSRRRWISCKPQSFRGRSLLRLALNGYTQIQIEKILFPIMNFRFSPSARLAEESLSRLKVIARKSQIFVAIQNTFNIQILLLRN